jgi:hypothetical protein
VCQISKNANITDVWSERLSTRMLSRHQEQMHSFILNVTLNVREATVATKHRYLCTVVHILTAMLCGLAVRVPGYRSRGPGSIPGLTKFSENQWVWNGVHSAS